MRRGFSVIDNPNHKGATDTWLTPLSIVTNLGGNFDLDPCGYVGHATAKTVFTSNGDTQKWFGRVWLNPPYSEVGRWLDMLADHGNGIALVFARTDTRWAQKHFKKANQVFFLKGRIKFLNSKFEESTNAGHGSMFLNYGPKASFRNFEGWLANPEPITNGD
jgi:hypothetical protein